MYPLVDLARCSIKFVNDESKEGNERGPYDSLNHRDPQSDAQSYLARTCACNQTKYRRNFWQQLVYRRMEPRQAQYPLPHLLAQLARKALSPLWNSVKASVGLSVSE